MASVVAVEAAGASLRARGSARGVAWQGTAGAVAWSYVASWFSHSGYPSGMLYPFQSPGGKSFQVHPSNTRLKKRCTALGFFECTIQILMPFLSPCQ